MATSKSNCRTISLALCLDSAATALNPAPSINKVLICRIVASAEMTSTRAAESDRSAIALLVCAGQRLPYALKLACPQSRTDGMVEFSSNVRAQSKRQEGRIDRSRASGLAKEAD